MIDEKKIENAARVCGSHFIGDNEDAAAQYGFKKGVNWALQEFKKSLWHDGAEFPCFEPSEIIVLASFDNEYYSVLYYNCEFMVRDCHHDDNNFFEQKDIVKWCYLSDLMPKEGGEE